MPPATPRPLRRSLITLDTIVPTVAITSTGGPVNQAVQTISGTGEAGTTITLSDNGSQLQLPTITVDQNGLWSASVTLANGSNSLTASDTDAAGNTGSSSAVIYTLSTTGPTVTESLTIDSGTSSSDRITSNDALTGTGLVNTVVHFTIDGSPIATTVTADAQGNWSFTPAGLADGPHTIVASQTDGFGNTGTASLSFTLDTTAPAVAITTIEGGDNIINAAEAAGGIQISGTAEIGSSLTVNGAAVTVDGTGHWTTSVTPAGQGALVVTAVATDAAGNSASTSTTLTVDTIAPAVAITTIEGGDNIINAAEAAGGIQISGTAEIGSSLTVNGAAVTVDGTGHWTTSVTPAGQGALVVTAVATDAAGNSATTSTTLTVDTIAPTGGTPDLVAASDSGVSSTDNITDVTAPSFTIALNPTVAAGDTVQLLLSGSPLAHPVSHTITAAEVTAGSVSLAVTAGDLGADGGKSISAQFSDAAGNTSTTAALTITLDTIVPTVAITSTGGPVNQAVQTISGTGEAGTTITLSDNGSQLQLPTITVDQNGLWSASVTLANGSNSLTASDTDAAGNTGSSSAVIYTLSTTGPTVTESLTIDSGTSSSDRITSNDALTGTGLVNTVVHFTIDGSPIATTVTADAQGNWSFTPAGLADGPHTIVASQTDGFGNTGTASLSFTLDTMAPAVAITTIEGGDNIINAAEAAGGIQISGTAEIGSSLTVNGAAVTVDGTGHWTTSVTPAGQGALVVTAVATDAAGNSTTHLDDADGGHHSAGGCDHHHRGRRQHHQCGGSGRRDPDQRHRRDRLLADGQRCGGDGGRHRALDHVGDAGGPGCAGGDGGCDRCGRQRGEHLDDADGGHHSAGGCDHHHRGRRQHHQCGGSGRRDPDQRHRRDRLLADGQRCGGDGGRHRALDHVGDAGGPGCAGGDGGCDRCGRQRGEHLDDADGGHHSAGGCDHHHRGWRQHHQCGGSGRRDPDQRHRRDRLLADGQRCGGDGGRHRALDHVGDAGGPGCAGGDGGCDRCGRQRGDHLDDADGGHHCTDRRHAGPGGGLRQRGLQHRQHHRRDGAEFYNRSQSDGCRRGHGSAAALWLAAGASGEPAPSPRPR